MICLVTVGKGSILLKNAASLSAVNISGVEESPEEDEFSWTFSNGTATYVKTSGTSGETLFTLSGLNPNLTVDDLDAGIEVSDGKIILSADVLAQKEVTLTTSGDYSLELGEDCPTVTAFDKGWTLDDTTATYHDAGKTDGYKLSTSAKSISYTAATGGKTLLTVNGLEVTDGAIDGLTVDKKTLTFTPDVVGENLSGDAGATINGGGKNDTLWGGDGSDTFIYESGGGKDVVYGFGNEDALQIGNFTATVKDNSIAFKVGSQTNAITLKDYTATTFNINGTNYKVDGSTLTKK